jgi:flagellar protein FlaG
MAQTETVKKITAVPIPGPSFDRMQKSLEARVAKEKRWKVEEAVRKFADAVSGSNVELSFSVDQSTNDVIIKVTDATTGKVIRQIPSEEMLRMSNNIKEMIGLFYDHSA